MRQDVIIIGAGPAGLAAAYELKQRGLEPRILDGAARIGEPWRNRHAALRLNTHRSFSGLPGVGIPASAGAYPSRDAFVAYLEDYERFLDVPIEYGVRVHRVDRGPGKAWTLATSRGRFIADDVVLATGPDRVPQRPHWPGEESFSGDLLHAADFKHPLNYAGRDVLIVGAGNSGVDLANCLLRVGTGSLRLSVRRPTWVVPTRLAGIPLQPMSVLLRKTPRWYQDASVATLSRLAFGDLSEVGLRRPDRGAYTRFLDDNVAVAIDDGFVAGLRRGAIEVVTEIERFDGDRVRLIDGREIAADVVICATGYRAGLEPIVGHLDVLDRIGRPKYLAGDFDSEWPGLWFVGQRSNFHGNLYARGTEGRSLARALLRRRRSEARRPARLLRREHALQ